MGGESTSFHRLGGGEECEETVGHWVQSEGWNLPKRESGLRNLNWENSERLEKKSL